MAALSRCRLKAVHTAIPLLLLFLLQQVSHTHAQENEFPYFSGEEVTLHISENFNTNLSINSDNPLQAMDDENDTIEYYIPNGGLGSLSFDIVTINESNLGYFGYLYFKSGIVLDRESRDEYNVRVYARDNQDHGNVPDSYIDVTVRITDINDNTPEFSNLPDTVTFSENTNINTELFQVVADDDDSGQNGIVRYSVIDVDPASGLNKFTIYLSSGQIFLAQSLDYESVTTYVLTVRAQDKGSPPLSTSEELTINVIDFNDNPPIFDQTMYDRQIYENVTKGYFVLSVSAHDQDIGINDRIIYSFNSSVPQIDGDVAFLINSTTGDITVNAKLDYESGVSSYSLFVKAAEASDPSMVAAVQVIITVLDINDNPPTFVKTNYNSTLTESTGIGTDVVTVMAMDPDSGINGRFEFELVNLLNTPFPFNITASPNGESGTIQLIDTLDYESYQMYKFEVRAVEVVNTNKKTATTTVTVTVVNENDNTPTFTKIEYAANVSENAPPGTLVTKVLAEDADIGTFGVVYYYLVNDYGKFTINRTTGLITTTDEINFETVQSYALSVVANDSATLPVQQKSQKVLVQVTILDVNDNGPVIIVNGSVTETMVTRNLEEAQAPGQLIFVVDAEDPDGYPHNELDYFLKVLSPAGLSQPHFEFSDQARNQLVTKVSLDYEEIQTYTIRLYVTDLGDYLQDSASGSGSGDTAVYRTVTDLPADHVDFIDVVLNVVDENDNNPKFVDGIDVYAFDVIEEEPNGTFVGSVKATDRDSGLFGTVRYSLSGIDHTNFSIDPVSGNITTNSSIDRERKDRFDLIVTATDLDPVQPLSSTATLTLTIIDINDNNPTFSQPIYYDNDIVENTIIISIPVTATDNDVGNNSAITYSIAEGNKGSTFIINSTTGIISLDLTKQLDRETYPDYHLLIQATDAGVPPRTGNATVIIVLQDQDDNDPTFSQPLYMTNITEDTTIGTVVTVITASDPDAGANGVVRYEFYPSVSNFVIDENTGTIRTAAKFNYETGPNSFTLNVRAQDNGDMGMPGATDVVIIILDVNDNAPVFSQSSYQISVAEDIDGDTSIRQVIASDADSGSNADILFYITSVETVGAVVITDVEANNVTDLFYVDLDSGILYLSYDRSLDYESVKTYNIHVTAVDNGSPSLNSSTVVTVTVTDVNDNEPELSEVVYYLTLSEATSVESTHSIALLSYTDDDSGSNGVGQYSITGTSIFSISPSTGVLTLKSPLDYETLQNFSFTLVVTDGGVPPMNDSATVYVTVTDSNDNSPYFTNPVSPFEVDISLYEGPYSEYEIFDFDANDLDSGVFGTVSFTITSASETGVFSLNSTDGRLFLNKTLNREAEDSYSLTITARDGGNPSRTATAAVSLTVLDVNEEPPYFTAGHYLYTINENAATGMTLVTVQATDIDFGANGTVYYSLSNDTLVSINSNGVITNKVGYDYELMHNFSVKVIASDGGSPSLSSNATLTVFINDLNDNYPQFEFDSYGPFTLSEDATNHILTRVSATDRDSGANQDITYQLENGQGKFSIDTENGDISLVSSLDRELTNFYTLTVKANDHGVVRLTSTISLNVSVSDINDNYPQLVKNVYTLNFPENTSEGSLIVTLEATDSDLGINGTVQFSIASGNIGNVFNITTAYEGNAYKGHIQLQGQLDYETQIPYTLVIKAYDLGTPSLTSTANIFLTVTNINDNYPHFSPSNNYSFQVSEVAAASTPVGTILALDNDLSPFGQIASYSFDDGTPADVTGNFTISASSGVISVSSSASLDYESKQQFSFNVKATDSGGLSSTASVVINVIDYNDNQPVFGSDQYYGNVSENLPAGQFVVRVHATDNEGNDDITYAIEDGAFSKFAINSTGHITTTGELDRETRAIYILRVRATDTGGSPLSGFTQVEIQILDTNDNPPEFSSVNVEYSLVESVPISTVLSPILTATDNDIGTNADITYYLTGEGVPSIFHINTTTAEISLQSSLNYEVKQNYSFTLYAIDGGSLSKRSMNVSVTLIVLDFNDNTPQLTQNTYTKTVNESFPNGGLLLQISATDDDQPGPNSEITYSITEVEGIVLSAAPFSINAMSGEIFTTAYLDYEQTTSYTITVKAEDNGTPRRLSTGTVIITVLDVNDNSPAFSQASYVQNIDEGDVGPDGKYVLTISAVDNDGTSPNNDVVYSITIGLSSVFSINSTTGEIRAIQNLDYEGIKTYTLTITAKDSPFDPADTRTNTTQVTINVQDINDNYPQWGDTPFRISSTIYGGNILESASLYTDVLVVNATDADSGAFGTIAYYLITPTGKFEINSTSGVVYTYGNLDYDLVSQYNLTVEARDGGSPPKTATALIVINVIDINDKTPSFLSSFYYESISEDAEVGTSVIDLNAFDADSPDLYYNIITGNELNFFRINVSNGLIEVNTPLDRETAVSIQMEIMVTDGSFNGTTNLQIVLVDVNDNAPQFQDSHYYTNITENTNSGPVLLYSADGNTTRIEAIDPDQPDTPNSVVVYELYGPNQGLLHIDPSSAVLTVASGAMLDYETQQIVEIIVIASDSVPAPDKKSSNVTITIFVEDANDNRPDFQQGSYSEALSEDTSLNTVLGVNIVAIDTDTGLGGVVEYSILSSNPLLSQELFEIDPTNASVTLVGQLDRETSSSINLTIMARDSITPYHSSVVSLFINVEDINDNPPVFDQTTYHVSAFEDIMPGSNIIKLNATDADISVNALRSFKLLTMNNTFNINPTTGQITTILALDHETDPLIEMVVQVCDKGVNPGPLCSNTTVVVTVLDVNDGTPMFDYATYKTSVCNDTLPGSVVLQVSATDTDSGSNGEVDFSLVGSLNSAFTFDNKSGQIILDTFINDNDTGITISFQIRATDNGSPQRSSTTSVEIYLCDRNNEIISFNQSYYYGDITENVPPPVIVSTVFAKSTAGSVTYSIIPPAQDIPFNISSNGEITTTEPLDRESRDIYTLSLQAIDNDTPPNTAYATVTVIVRDINDHPPKFLLTPYTFTITEEESHVVFVGVAIATDPDQPFAESGVIYSIDPASNPDGAFHIDQNNGSITAIKPIDREIRDQIQLKILATDLDPLDQRVTTATAVITVLDINDNKPIFEMDGYYTSILENVPPSFKIGEVTATDLDINENKRITYSIVSGSESKFNIESNLGYVRTTNELDFETNAFYNLTIKAQDAGNPSLSSFTYFEITIEDVNDCTPQFNQAEYGYSNLPEDTVPGQVLFDIDVSDCDSGQNSNITFSITGGQSSPFSLDPWTGVITVSGSLDYETIQDYQFDIKAADLGNPSLFNLTIVSITILDVNDETPMFVGGPYEQSIVEDVTNGYIFLTVSAQDGDRSSANNVLSFKILSGNENNHFSINQASGQISVVNSLDRESQDSHFLVIEVTDNGVPSRSDNTTLNITVLDVNDNPPAFVNLPTDPINVKENSTNVSDLIYTVMANDPDIGENGLVEFQLNTFENIFSIGITSGEILRVGVLDYEDIKEYELSIQVTDAAPPYHKIPATLRIIVDDINDNDPIFTLSEYTGTQAEETEPQTEVIVTVHADDADETSINSAITYVITECINCGDETLFEINSTSGDITNTKKLSHEQNTWYRLTVMAINLGADPQRNTTASVYITVTDINDHSPVFNQTSYSATISELIADNSHILTVLATDGDEPNTDNSEVHYFITTVIPNNPFSLDENTGELLISGSLDRESIPTYSFMIQATDRGSPQMSSNVPVTITLTDENDKPPVFVEKTKTVQVSEGTSSFPHALWRVDYTDDDLSINKESRFGLLREMNGTQPIGVPLIFVNASSGEVLLTGPVDYETTKSIIGFISVNNTVIGVGDLCGGGLTSKCTLWDTAELTIEVTDYNDNPPVLQRSKYSSQVSTEAHTGTQVLQIIATDADTQQNFANIQYQLGTGSSPKFRIDSTGWIITRGTFTNNDGETFTVLVEAYDNLGNAPSFTATATVEILAISDFKRVLVLFNCGISSFTEEKENFIVQTLSNLTGYNIIVEEVREHVLSDSGEVDSTKTDFIFHAVDPRTGEIIDFDTFIVRLDVDRFFEIVTVATCNPSSITSLQQQESYPQVETVMYFLITLCFILTLGAIVLLVLACQQRYIAINSIMKDRVLDAFYGNPDPSLLEGGAMPRDFSGESFEMKGRVTKNMIYTDPHFHLSPLETSRGASSVGDASSMQQENPLYSEYADEELRVDLFQPPSDEETEGDIDEGRLLHAAIHADDFDDNDSTTLI